MRRMNCYNWCVLLMGLGFAALPVRADIHSQCPQDLDGVDTDGDGDVANDHVCMHVTAGDGFINMADGPLTYMFGFSDVTDVMDEHVMHAGMLSGSLPAPTIEVSEGQKLYLSLSNVGMMLRPDLFDPHSVHWHGFPQAAPIFDGVPEASVVIGMGSTFTYFYNVVEAGTYMWHCHVEATEHMQMGMLGNLFVHPMQNNLPDGTDLNGFTHHTGYRYAHNDGDGSTYYDVAYPIQMHSFDPKFHEASISVQPLPFANMKDTYAMFNGRGYPDTTNQAELLNTADDLGYEPKYSQKVHSLIEATQGDLVLLRISNLSVTEFFTVTALGIPMRVVAQGARLLRGPGGEDLSYATTAVTLGGGEAVDVILNTTDVPAGTYFLYTTNLNYLSNNTEDFGGMMTEIVITAPVAAAAGDRPPARVPTGDRVKRLRNHQSTIDQIGGGRNGR